MRARRTPVLAAVALLLGAGGLADRLALSHSAASVAASNRALMPSASPPTALSSTWFCVGATSGAATGADGVVEIANPTDHEATGTVSVFPLSGQTASLPVSVKPMSSLSVALHDVVQAPWAAATVDLNSGQVTAELVVHGPSESDATPCSSRASDRWHFADGSTAKDASLIISLFNPFPEDAIVDLSFSTDQGRAAPSAFRPIVVPARTLVVRDVGEHVRRRSAIATELSVRTGRVVAAQTQTRSADGRAGLTVSLGAPSLGTLWQFAEGKVTDGIDEHYSISNPGRREATLLFQVILDQGVAQDFERTVPAGSRLDVVLNEELGVPRGIGHSTTVQSLDGVPVVVSRALNFAPPALQAGRVDTIGARRTSTRWLFAAGTTNDAADEWLVVANTGTTSTRISVTGLTGGGGLAVDGLQGVVVEPGHRASFRLDDHVTRDALSVVVTASTPVLVERAIYVAAGGAWVGPGIPLN